MFTALIPLLGGILDKVIPDPARRAEAKLALLEAQQAGALNELKAMQDIIVAEASSEHVLTATWRPVVMLTFTALVVAHFLGLTAENVSEEMVDGLLQIVQYGLTGYIVGRSAEKGIAAWKK
jgi:hypothetical protein|tara:strand:- start:14060 stop:14425 length:366 start_codon:yes stop_codon:yes gene_type:complete